MKDFSRIYSAERPIGGIAMSLNRIVVVLAMIGLWTGWGRAADSAEILPWSQEASEISFRNHIQPVLTKAGCNMGACHGAAAGKNGFYLSLRGYDDVADYAAVTRNSMGRRIVPSDPGRSLMLTKPTGAVPHKGGKRFEIDSPEYQVLVKWIANGAPGPKAEDARLVKLELLPRELTTSLGATQALTVRAHFSSGRIEDVTRWAKYTAVNAGVVQVDDQGVATVQGYGEGIISAWYLSQMVVSTVTVPYPKELPPDTFSKLRRRNFIDDSIHAKLKVLNLPPSPPTIDVVFLRRAYLDTTGTLPSPDDVREFMVEEEDLEKRQKRRDALIEKLLSSPEFIDYWAYKWSDLLLVSSAKLPPRAARVYYAWVRSQVERGVPWDELVRGVLTAQGSTMENGAANFYVLHDDPKLMAETATQAFLGMSINCAKCHNHPMEKWTNDEYYGFANLFARLRMKAGTLEGEHIVVSTASGDLPQPRTGKPQLPKPLDGKPMQFDASGDRRVHLADWMVSPKNPYFAKAIVNRIWGNFFGVGLVERLDDLRVTNPASNEPLLTETADFLVKNRYDLRAVMRAILQSESYQRSSLTIPGNENDHRFYSRYLPRRLMAEVILDAMSQVTEVPTVFAADALQGRKSDFNYPLGLRALQLPDSFVQNYFLKSFGRPDRAQTCECERSAEPTVSQVLHLSNGDTLNQKLSAKENRLSRWMTSHKSPSAWIEEASVTALARLPRPAEKEKLVTVLSEAAESEQRAVLEDAVWAMLNSKEFLYNH